MSTSTSSSPVRIKLSSKGEMDSFLNELPKTIAQYEFDHYRSYPSKDRNHWQKFLLVRLQQMFSEKERMFFGEMVQGFPILVGCRIAQWDEDHFGFRIGKIDCMIAPSIEGADDAINRLLVQCLEYLSAQKVKCAIARLDGDDLRSIHALESKNFRYYENMIWPVVECSQLNFTPDPRVRLLRDSDIERVLEIAQQHQYKRGHFYCDTKLDPKKVDSMYIKWIQTSLKNKEPITVVEDEGRVMGSFAFRFDPMLSEYLGYQYGRMHLLTLDPAARGKGLGLAFFKGSAKLIADMGCHWIDSGYATKNHISARLHNKTGFQPVYEELSFHLWL